MRLNMTRFVALFFAALAACSAAPTGSASAQNGVASKVANKPLKKGDPELKKLLTPLQYAVTQRDATETPFRNEYWDNEEAGIYVDVVSGEPLFSSTDKYDSGTGWPSFTKPLEPGNVKKQPGGSLFWGIEVRSATADSHLGHVFNDGPKPAGLRYCINSAATRFIPVSRLAAEGYGKYLPLFQKSK